jgi:predicted Zn finger-like uncharacterized protein
MDVRCDRCKTEYELDETRISDAGLTVKCTHCGNIFKVRKPFATTPGLDVPPPKEWRVRRQDGQQLALRNLTELQRWIVERRVGPNDEVSLSGETWRKLGTLPELGAFFEVVQVAEGRTPDAAPPVSRDVAMSDTMMGIPAADSGPYAGRSKTPAWSGQAGVLPNPAAPEPAWANGGSPSVDVDVDEQLSQEELKHLRGGRGGTWVAVIVVLVAVGAGAAWFLRQPSSPPGTLPAPHPAPPPSFEPRAAPEAAIPAAPVVPEAKPPTEPVAEPKPAAEAKPAAEVKPAPEAKAPPAPAAPHAVVAAAATPKDAVPEGSAIPSGKGINWYLGQGHRLLDVKPEQALKYFAKAGEVDPRSPEPDSGRGLAYSNLERWGDAIAAFQASLKKNPEYTEAIMGLAEAYRAQGSLVGKRKALALYQRYLDLTPDGPDAPVAKAQVEILGADLKAAEAPAAKSAPTEASPSPPTEVREITSPAPAPTAVPSDTPAPPPPVLAPDIPPKNGP